MTSFFQDNITCRFDSFKHILSGNGTPSVNSHVRQLREQYEVDHDKSSLDYLQRNGGQAELPTRLYYKLLTGWSMRNIWTYFISLMLWAGLSYLEAYFNSSHAFLSYLWAQGYGLIKVLVHSSRLALATEVSNFRDRIQK